MQKHAESCKSTKAGELHIIRGLDPVDVSSPYKTMFVRNAGLQEPMAKSKETKIFGEELDGYSTIWLRLGVHPSWIHTRSFDDKQNEFMKHVLSPYVVRSF